MNTLANSELLVLLPSFVLAITLFLTALVKSNNIVSMAFAVLTGNVVRATYTSEALVKEASIMNNLWSIVGQWFLTRKDDIVVLASLAFCVTVYTMQAVVKGIIALAIGTVTMVVTAAVMMAIGAYKLGEYTATTTTNTYRKVRTSLKARILNWLGVTAEINQLKRENAKLQLQVRRLEILNDVNVVEDSRQAEVDEMTVVLDAEFRAQLNALSNEDVQGLWLSIFKVYRQDGAFEAEWAKNDIMGIPPIVRSTALRDYTAPF